MNLPPRPCPQQVRPILSLDRSTLSTSYSSCQVLVTIKQRHFTDLGPFAEILSTMAYARMIHVLARMFPTATWYCYLFNMLYFSFTLARISSIYYSISCSVRIALQNFGQPESISILGNL